MPKYEDWAKAFLKGKTEVPVQGNFEKFALHSLRRYLDENGLLWETAKTYTDRLVSRSGKIDPDGIGVKWEGWVTHHDVTF